MTQGEMDVFEGLGAPAYEPYDSFSGYDPWEYSRNFPIEAYAPEQDFLADAWKPMDEFGRQVLEMGGRTIQYGFEKAPEILFGLGAQALRKVDEGAGVTVIHSQAPQAGGTPAQPIQKVIPGQWPFYTPVAGAPPQAIGAGTMILIGAGLVVLYILSR